MGTGREVRALEEGQRGEFRMYLVSIGEGHGGAEGFLPGATWRIPGGWWQGTGHLLCCHCWPRLSWVLLPSAGPGHCTKYCSPVAPLSVPTTSAQTSYFSPGQLPTPSCLSPGAWSVPQVRLPRLPFALLSDLLKRQFWPCCLPSPAFSMTLQSVWAQCTFLRQRATLPTPLPPALALMCVTQDLCHFFADATVLTQQGVDVGKEGKSVMWGG